MKKIGFFIVVLSTILTACGASSLNSANKTATSSTPTYTTTQQTTQAEDQKTAYSSASYATSNASANSSASATRAQTVPSSSKLKHLLVGQQVSLIKAEQATESQYNTDRKIVRNAELDLEADSP